MTVSVVLDAAGRRRSPATMPGYHAGRPPRNKGRLYPADPPTVEEIVAVMREASDDRHGYRPRALIVVLWRGGLRVAEALALGERDLDPARRGSLLVRNGEGGAPPRARHGRLVLGAAAPLARGPPRAAGRAAVLRHRRPDPRASPGPAPTRASNSADSPPKRESGAASRRTSSATRMPSSSPAKASR